MEKTKLSPTLQELIRKFKIRISTNDEESLDKLIEFAYHEGHINGQYELYNNTPKSQ